MQNRERLGNAGIAAAQITQGNDLAYAQHLHHLVSIS